LLERCEVNRAAKFTGTTILNIRMHVVVKFFWSHNKVALRFAINKASIINNEPMSIEIDISL
jgi:hypothetical protein